MDKAELKEELITNYYDELMAWGGRRWATDDHRVVEIHLERMDTNEIKSIIDNEL